MVIFALLSCIKTKEPIIVLDTDIPYKLNKDNRYEPKPVSKDSAKIAIDTLYYFAKTNPNILGISMLANYVIDFESLNMVLDSNTKASLRIFPALWPLGKGTNKFKFTLILVKEVNGTVDMGGSSRPNGGNDSIPDDSIYEYLIPCPPRCKEDFYNCEEWVEKLKDVGVDTSNLKCPKE
jgi:hypothetical protein